jgi:hypothetical protein
MGFRRPAAATILLLTLAAGEAPAQGEWILKSPAIERKTDRRAAAAALAGLAAAGFVLWRRRRRSRR